jgi:hypothetical protein
MSLPSEVTANRARIAASYLQGHGIEIGALDEPTPLPSGARARYIDIQPPRELRRQFCCSTRHSFPSISSTTAKARRDCRCLVDFLIANHMVSTRILLGPCATICARSNQADGCFTRFEMRCCFDSVRPLTTLDHLVADDADGGAGTRHSHLVEWVTLVGNATSESEVNEKLRDIARRGVTIHFHVWDSNSLLDHLCRARHYLADAYEIRHFELAGPEIVTVMRRC